MVLNISKIVAASLLLLLVPAREARGGWQRQAASAFQQTGFFDLSAVSPTFAVAVGLLKKAQETPVVMITRDGESWTEHYPHVRNGPYDVQHFRSVWFENEQHGYVGGGGMIWTTDDGGESWVATNLGGAFEAHISSIHSAAPSAGVFAVTGEGDLLKTTDGGKSWPAVARPLGGNIDLNQVHFVDADHGWVIAGQEERDILTDEVLGFKGGALARTTDGGKSWKVIFKDQARAVTRVSFLDANNGWLISHSLAGAKLEASSDGGESWQEVSWPRQREQGEVNQLVDVHFFDRCEGWLVGNTYAQVGEAVLWHTVDGGQTWIEQTDREFLKVGQLLGVPFFAALWSVGFVDREVGFAGGNFESLFRYDADQPAPACGEEAAGCCAVAGGAQTSAWPLLLVAALWLLRRHRRTSVKR